MKKGLLNIALALCLLAAMAPAIVVQVKGDNMGKKGQRNTVSAGWNHTAVITADGTLFTCGANNSGQLGNGTIDASYKPIEVPIKVMDHVASVSAGDDYTAAITTSGTLYTWGRNDYGQLESDLSRIILSSD